MSGPKLSEAELERMRQAELERRRQERLALLQDLEGWRQELSNWSSSRDFQRLEQALPQVAVAFRRELAQALKALTARDASLDEDSASFSADTSRIRTQCQRVHQQVLQRWEALLEALDWVSQLQQWLGGENFDRMQKQIPGTAHTLRQRILKGIAQMGALMCRTDYYGSARKQCAQIYSELIEVIQSEDSQITTYHRALQNHQFAQRLFGLMQNSSEDVVVPAVESFLYDGDTLQLRARLLALADVLGHTGDANMDAWAMPVSAKLRKLAQQDNLSDDKQAFQHQIEAVVNGWQELLRRRHSMDQLYARYCALSDILGRPPRPRDSFDDQQKLREAVLQMEKEYQKKDEMDYIADQINQVMVELGYTFVSSTAMRRSDGSEYDDSLYQADSQAGVRVYTDESGAVMMQVTNFGDGDLTDWDRDESYQLQLDFCASHQDIVQKLAERGVLLRQRHYAAPSKKFAVKQRLTNQGVAKAADRRKRRRGKQKMRSL